MKKGVILGWTMATLVALTVGATTSGSVDKTTELNRKMIEIASLQQTLAGKISRASDMQNHLEQEVKKLKEEILEEKELSKIDSYQKAVRNLRINYNLKLIRQLLGYTEKLKEKISYFQDGHETLHFYFQQIQDDLMVIKALDDLEIDKLIAQINSTLDEYIPETQKPLLNVDDVNLREPETIWNDIVAK